MVGFRVRKSRLDGGLLQTFSPTNKGGGMVRTQDNGRDPLFETQAMPREVVAPLTRPFAQRPLDLNLVFEQRDEGGRDGFVNALRGGVSTSPAHRAMPHPMAHLRCHWGVQEFDVCPMNGKTGRFVAKSGGEKGHPRQRSKWF